MKFKKLFIFICTACLLVAATSCDKKGKTEEITLSAEDVELLEKVEDDLNIINDDNYVDTVLSFMSGSDDIVGNIYSIEGILKYIDTDGEKTAFLYRNYNDGTEITELGIELRYLPYDIGEGDWIKITGILSKTAHEGHSHVSLDVVTVETPEEHGSEMLGK